ncbi:sensor histidine kinase [Rothia sp. ZJ1223]|uniref:sensor histidine kinase n=1 Tax=Rothia sp. ZJ1223 TaxID=2811098 RepID=UPI001957A1AE|nr:ATP-binding protein [Rothia sp. ZJ1223]MBM7052079.1 hypothetical protein [Rothia sp. ZJ1223]
MATNTDVTKDLARSLSLTSTRDTFTRPRPVSSQGGNGQSFVGSITFALFCRLELFYAVLGVVIVVQMVADPGTYSSWYNLIGLLVIIHSSALTYFSLRKEYLPALIYPAAAIALLGLIVWPLALEPGDSPYSWMWTLPLYGVLTPLILLSARGIILSIVCFTAIFSASLIGAHSATNTEIHTSLVLIYIAYVAGSCTLLAGFVGTVIDAAHNADTLYTETLGAHLRVYRTRDISKQLQEFDKLVHDNVMATLLDASRQQGLVAERTRKLAQRALSVLDQETAKTRFELPTTFQTLTEQVAEGISPWNNRLRFNDSQAPHNYPAADSESVLPAPAARAFVHAVTEAVSNSARHSGSRTTQISIRTEYRRPLRSSRSAESRSFIICTISDRGTGFSLKDIDIRRMGVRVSMMHSMREVGGEVYIDSSPAKGTKVTVQWPGEK